VKAGVLCTRNTNGCRLPPVGDTPSREEQDRRNEVANLYMRGVNEGHEGRPLDAQEALEVLQVFGEEGATMYLIGILEGQQDRLEEEGQE
jgi:hypothetical protein